MTSRARDASPRLTSALPGWDSDAPEARGHRHVVGVLPGEGVGPGVTAVVTDLLAIVADRTPHRFDIRIGGPIGLDAKESHGVVLPPEVVEFCERVFAEGGAVLCGPGGGRFVYELRARFDLFCKLTPVRPLAALRDAGVLRPEALAGVDVVVVRENVSGDYYGRSLRRTDSRGRHEAIHRFRYGSDEVRRILDVAVRLARSRRKRLALAVKTAGLPAFSGLWTELFEELTQGQGLATTVLEVDNAGYQIIAAAPDFDVVVAPNLFGDILSDVSALLLGSRGLSHSGNFGAPRVGVYQTGHGSAHNIAGKDIANPIGQILSAAMMLRESFGASAAATAIEAAVDRTLAAGTRTSDIAASGCRVVGTREMGQCIARALEQTLAVEGTGRDGNLGQPGERA